MSNIVRIDESRLRLLVKYAIPMAKLIRDTFRTLRAHTCTGRPNLALYDVRRELNRAMKERIAETTAGLIATQMPGAAIVLDSGTVTYFLALSLWRKATHKAISTNNLAIISELTRASVIGELHSISGSINSDLMAATGPAAAADAQRKLRPRRHESGRHDLAVLGLRAFGASGAAEDHPELVDYQRVLYEKAPRLIMVAQGEKFAKPSQYPLLSQQAFSRVLRRRVREGSVWLVHSEPTAPLDQGQRALYQRNLDLLVRDMDPKRVLYVPRGGS